MAEFQLTLGEGPCHDVVISAAPVLAGDLGDTESSRRWPAFTPAACRLGAGAVFAFPLIVGAIRAGVLGLYRDSPGPLSGRQLGDMLILADAATMMLLSDADGHGAGSEDGAVLDGQAPDLALHRAEIDQATGMLTEQLGGRGCGGVRPAAGLRLCPGPAARGRGRRYRRPAAAAAPRPGSGRRPVIRSRAPGALPPCSREWSCHLPKGDPDGH